MLFWGLFSAPYLLEGLVPYPSFFQSNFFAPWSAYSTYVGPVKNNAMPDIITQIYPWRDFTIDSLKNLQIPFWNPYSFAGTPHLANYQSAVFFPLNILFFLPIGFVNSWSLLVLLQPLLAGLGMLVLLRNYKLSQIPSVMGAVSFMFCGFIVTWMGYATLGYAIVFLPLAFFFIDKFMEQEKSRYGVMLSITLALSFFAGHFQTSIYLLIAVFSYVLFIGIRKKEKRRFVYLIIYLASGIFISMPQILPSIEFYLHSVRQTIVTQLEVIPMQYIPTLFAPDVFGNPVTRNDWLGHYAEWNGFTGTSTLILAFFAAISLLRKNKKVLYFSILAIFSLLVAFDTPVNALIFKLNLPLFSTSASSRIIVLLSFSLSVLAAFGVDYLKKNIKEISFRRVLLFLGIGLFFTVLSWTVSLVVTAGDVEKFIIARNNLIVPTGISLVVSALILALYFFKKRRNLISIILLFMLIITAFDLYRFANKWMPFSPKEFIFKETGVSNFYENNLTQSRYLGNLSAENSVYYRLQSLGGYDPLYPSRYGEFVKYIEKGIKEDGDRSVVNFPLRGERVGKAMDFIGTEFIPQKRSDDSKPWAFNFDAFPVEKFEVVYEDDAYRIFRNKDAFPRAFVVGSYIVEDNDLKTLQLMFADDTNLRDKVFLEKSPQIESHELNVSSAEVVAYSPNSVEINVNSENRAILVLTDNFYPGWKAYINNENTEILRADYTFRAVVVPEGNSIVRFEYLPQSFIYGLYTAILGSTVLVVMSLVYNKKRK